MCVCMCMCVCVYVRVCACPSPGTYLQRHRVCAVSDDRSHARGELPLLPLPVVDEAALLVTPVVP